MTERNFLKMHRHPLAKFLGKSVKTIESWFDRGIPKGSIIDVMGYIEIINDDNFELSQKLQKKLKNLQKN